MDPFRKIIVKFRTAWKRSWARVFIFMNEIRLPGFKGMGLYDVARFFFDGLKDRRFTLASAAMAYRFFFALFPGLIFIATLIPMLPFENLDVQVRSILENIVPPDSQGFVDQAVNEFFKRPNFGLLSANVALLLYSATGGIKAMMRAFSKEAQIFKRRNVFVLNFYALAIFLVLVVLFVFSISIWVAGEYAISWMKTYAVLQNTFQLISLTLLHWFVILMTIFLAISILYYLGPETRKRFSFFSPGSITAGVMSFVAMILFRYVVTQFTTINKIYGSLSAIMVLMVWFYYLSIVLLIGFELNAAIEMARDKKSRKLRMRRKRALDAAGSTVDGQKSSNDKEKISKMNRL